VEIWNSSGVSLSVTAGGMWTWTLVHITHFRVVLMLLKITYYNVLRQNLVVNPDLIS
jgi:hypothetical protein